MRWMVWTVRSFWFCVLGIVSFGVIYVPIRDCLWASKSFAQYYRYDLKRTGQLVRSYAARYDSTTSYYMFRVYSYEDNEGSEHNCTLRVGHRYVSRFGAKQAAKQVALGTTQSLYIAKDDPIACIDQSTRAYDYEIAVSSVVVSAIQITLGIIVCLMFYPKRRQFCMMDPYIAPAENDEETKDGDDVEMALTPAASVVLE